MIHGACQIVLCVAFKAEREEQKPSCRRLYVRYSRRSWILVYEAKPEVVKVADLEQRGSKSRNLLPLLCIRLEEMLINGARVVVPLGQTE